MSTEQWPLQGELRMAESPIDTSYTPLSQLIDRQVALTPDAVAVQAGEELTSYADLDRLATGIACALREAGVASASTVGMCLRRSRGSVASLLACWRVGAAYLPLDPASGSDRLGAIAADAGLDVVIVDPDSVHLPPPGITRLLLPGGARAELAEAPPCWPTPSPEQLAYVLYTSGSTGRPKGVEVAHAGLSNRLQWMQSAFGLRETDRVVHKTSLSFDVSLWEILWPLMYGGRIVIADEACQRSIHRMAELIEATSANVIHFVPSVLHAFVRQGAARRCESLRLVVASGEELSHETVTAFKACSRAALHNLYGPTEASIDVSHWACAEERADQVIPIGKPIWNTAMYVLDDDRRRRDVGEEGEIWISGVGLARGYRGRPDLTAASFVDNPFEGGAEPYARMYRTGDLGRQLPSGDIEFLGRIDDQVKIGGRRVELAAITDLVLGQPGVADAVVLRREAEGGAQLIAYVVCEPGTGDRAARAVLAASLVERTRQTGIAPRVLFVDALPRASSGKVDRAALLALDAGSARPDEAPPFVAPAGRIETMVASIWASVLGIGCIGADDDFWALGGDSLTAMTMAGVFAEAARPVLGADVPIELLLVEHPRLRDLARAIEAAGDCREGAD